MNHILIAEDEHLIARLVEMTLTRAGYRCTRGRGRPHSGGSDRKDGF